jgi:hypothetical protein
MKKGFLAVCVFLLCFSFAFADTITDYRVPDNIPLNQLATATGLFEDSNGIKDGYLCSFYFLDATTGDLIKRATDQYSTKTGRFTMAGFPITEPLFKRDSNYTLRSECGTASADANFTVGQIETLSHAGEKNFEFITNPENTDTFFIWGALIVLLAIFIFGIISLFKMRVR